MAEIGRGRDSPDNIKANKGDNITFKDGGDSPDNVKANKGDNVTSKDGGKINNVKVDPSGGNRKALHPRPSRARKRQNVNARAL